MPGVSGRKALVKVAGAAVTFTDEATTSLGDNKRYQITATTKRVWDRATALAVKVAGVLTGESYTYNRLTGIVTFATVDAGRGAVTLSGKYVPMSVAVGAKNYSFSIARAMLVDTDFDSANTNNGFDSYQTSLLSVEGSIGARLTTDPTLRDVLLAGNPVVIQLYVDRSGDPDLTLWALLDKHQAQAAFDAVQDGTIGFKGTADDQGVVAA